MPADRVSIVVCCHNSAANLPQTLVHLAAQTGVLRDDWEVVVVDNASTDGSSAIALDLWGAQERLPPLRIVTEPKLGLTHARLAGLAAARFEILSFVDDDNWVCDDWCARVRAIMARDPTIGVVGGRGIPAFQADGLPPAWFERFQRGYAVGEQGTKSGPMVERSATFFGAGLTVRKLALAAVLGRGFEPLLTDRKGTALGAGGDSELCYALALDGWQLWYDADLVFRHFMPARRLTTEYVKQMWYGFGYSSVILDMYRLLRRVGPNWNPQWLARWLGWRCRFAHLSYLRSRAAAMSSFDELEQIAAELRVRYAQGRLRALAEQRRQLVGLIARTQAWLNGLPGADPQSRPRDVRISGLP